MLKEIIVGKTYRHANNGGKRTPIFVSNKYVVFYYEDDVSYEDFHHKSVALENWEEIPEEMWVNVYSTNTHTYSSIVYKSKKEALKSADTIRSYKGTYQLMNE